MTRILLVEDNELNRDMLARRLKRRGFEVLTAVDGEEALALVRSEMPDIVLMDMSLPKMDGWTATKHIKEDSQTAHIPVLALTAHAMIGDRERALEVGCDEYETKPVDFQRLLQKIEMLLQKSRS
ncbi:MAG: response regulator [Ardenticatenia bacterium]|nr:MAG: response regulator [Ardenticatenia bacterium]